MSAVDPAKLFAALGDPTRLGLLARLGSGGSQSIAALSDGGPVTRQAVTKHLRVLESAGFVRHMRVGRESRFAFQPEPVEAARSYLDAVSAQWDAAIDRLRAFVES